MQKLDTLRVMMGYPEKIRCRFCGTEVTERFIDVLMPISMQQGQNDTTKGESLAATYVCTKCFFIQTERKATVARDHVFLSSFSPYWLSDVKWYADRLFKKIEQTENGMEIELLRHNPEGDEGGDVLFFGLSTITLIMDVYEKADTLVCHDELFLSTDVEDFLNGVRHFVKPQGIATIRIKQLLPWLQQNESCEPCPGSFNLCSFTTLAMLLARHGLTAFDVVECDNGGSLLVKVRLKENSAQHLTKQVHALYGRERDAGMSSISFYKNYMKRIRTTSILKQEQSY